MKISFLLAAAAVVAPCAFLAQSQTPKVAPYINEMHRAYTQYKGFWTRAAAAMPEDGYSFHPACLSIANSQEMRTFAALLAHVADHQTRFCSQVLGEPKQGDAASKTTKADLQAALAASYTICDQAWDSMNDTTAAEMVGQRTKLGTLFTDVAHSEEEYGYMSVYFRAKGILPPSSDRSGGR